MTQPLRIGFDAKRAFLNHTGLGNYSRYFIKMVLDNPSLFDTYLYTPKTGDRYQASYFRGAHIITASNAIMKNWWRTYGITRHLTHDKLDVYHGLSNELPVNIRNFKGKKIVTIHDLIFLRYPDYYPFIDRYIYKKKFQMACQMADVVIATSQQTADDINFFFGTPPSKIKVIYQSCDERYAIKVDADSKDAVRQRYLLPPKFFLSVGTFEQRKQQIRMVQAFSKMKHSDDSLILIGKKTPYVDELRKVIHQYDLNHRIKILHHVPNEDLPALYSLAHAFIFASEYEGFGIPVLEALQTGTPLIVSHSSSLPEVAGKAAFYFPPHDTDALADLMNKVSDENFDREAFHEERMAQLLHFSKEALSKQLFEVYTH